MPRKKTKPSKRQTITLESLGRWLDVPDADTIFVVALSHDEVAAKGIDGALVQVNAEPRVLAYRVVAEREVMALRSFRYDLVRVLAGFFKDEAHKEAVAGGLGEKIEHTTREIGKAVVDELLNRAVSFVGKR